MLLVGFTAGIWVVNGVQWWRTRPTPGVSFSTTATSMSHASSPGIPPESGSYLRGLSVQLADLARDNPIIHDRTFEDCDLYGPAIVFFEGCMCTECRYDAASAEDLCIVISEPRNLIGVIMFSRCVLRRCRFKNVGMIATPHDFAQLAAIPTQRNK